MTTTISRDWQSERLMDEDRLHPDEERMLRVFGKRKLIPNMGELLEELGEPKMSHADAHVAVCNLAIKGHVAFSFEGYRLIS